MNASSISSLALIFALGCDPKTGASDSGGADDSASSQGLTASDIVGRWSSPGCEAYDDGQGGHNYLTRTFELTETSWHLDLVVFGDADCSFPLFSGAIDGPYVLGDASASVAEATEGTFSYTSIQFTAHTADLAAAFTGAGCGAEAWEVDVPQEVSGTGCIGVAHDIDECPAEYDLVGLVGGQLYFGERVTDMCTVEGRPAALGPYGLDPV